MEHTSEGKITSETAQDEDSYESEKHKKSGGFFGRKKSVSLSETTTYVCRNYYTAGGKITFQAEDDLSLRAPSVSAKKKVSFISEKGRVYLLTDTATHMFQLNRSGKNEVWQYSQNRGAVHEDVQGPAINAPLVEVKGAQPGVYEAKAGTPAPSWASGFQIRNVEELHEKWNKKTQGMTAGATAFMALAIVVATACTGVGGALIGCFGEGLLAGAAEAAVLGGLQVCAQQAAIGLINNKGNIGKCLKDATSKEQMRGLGIAMATAALTFGICKQLGISQDPKGVADRLHYSAVQTGVSTAFTVISQDQDLGKAFIQAGVNIAANVAGAKLANEIGAGFRGGDFDWVTHKLFHGLLGAGIGAAANLEDPGKGALGGATAAIAEAIVEQLPKDFSKELRKGIAVMSAATVALIVGGDVNAAGLAATNAVENNNFINISISEEAAEVVAENGKQVIEFAMEEVEGAAKVKQGYHTGVDGVFDFLQGQYAGIYGADIIAEIFFPAIVQGMHPALLDLFPGLKGVVPTKGQLFDGIRKCAHMAGDIAIPRNRLDVALVGAGFLKFPAGIINAVKGGRYALQATPEAVNAARGLAALDVERLKFNPKIFDKTITWTAPKGTQQTYKVFQRNDINWDMVRTKGDIRYRGKTNLEASKAGLAPQLNDGYFATLHHIGQDSRGALVEASRRYHGVDAAYHNILHGQFGKNKSNPFYPVDHKLFRKETAEYWKKRVK